MDPNERAAMFTGQERDGGTVTLDYFDARHFSAVLGSMTQPDPGNAGGDILNPQSWNAYAYVLGNPLGLVDPSGMYAEANPGGQSGTPEEDDQEAGNELYSLFMMSSSPYATGGGAPSSIAGHTTTHRNILSAQQVMSLVHKNNLSKQCDELVDCIIFKESESWSGSGYDANTVPLNKKGKPIPGATARGLMQVQPDALTYVLKKLPGLGQFEQMSKNLLDPATNIQIGSAYLGFRVQAFGLKEGVRRFGNLKQSYADSVLNCVLKLQSGDLQGAIGALH